MTLSKIMAALAACLLVVALAKPAEAKRYNKHYHQAAMPAASIGADRDDRYSMIAAQSTLARRARKFQRVPSDAGGNPASQSTGGFTTNALVTEARKYIGTNPTGRASLWCGAFMDLVLKRTGHAGGGNLASAYARYGTRVAGPQVGAIAVMSRTGGGHVGVVTGVDRKGNPIILSGNTWNRSTGGRYTVAEGVYPRRRVYAYVVPK